MKGIILAGGSGTRLYPITQAVSKQLLPVYDKPLIYYPLSTLMLAGIKEILVISTPQDLNLFKKLLGDGSQFGVQLSYAEQAQPNGLAEAFLIGKDFIGDDPVCLILGDNIFYGADFVAFLQKSVERVSTDGGATVYGYWVNDPERYGVVEFDESGKAVSIEEKPVEAKSNYAVVGIYFYDNEVINLAQNQKPSARGELEITGVNQEYLKAGKLHIDLMSRGSAWLDVGLHESLLDAGNFIKTLEDRQGLKIACPEEIAFEQGWITVEQLQEKIELLSKNQYGQYLKKLLLRHNKNSRR
ncbi:MAG: glucose-1-phosphate thymidylyltransferase RfbA [SAR324 cluster bacterium]|nr:glucose-1-phosphate thymidylyltransferase RfbA [SAR324 cluster bacterium]